MKVTVNIKRYQPEITPDPFYQRYDVEVEPTDRVLDALMQIKKFQDTTLAFRRSCAHGVCGSDAMVIGGKERLACKTLIRDLVKDGNNIITIEPLRAFPVLRDLIVDQTSFFEKHQSIKPYLINDEPAAEKERIQFPAERKAFDDVTGCILCCACFSACPVMETEPKFIGPAHVAQASRFLNDSRDRGFKERLPVLDSPDGVWLCENHFNCTRACPRSIKITKRINETKKKIQDYRKSHSRNFEETP